MASAVNHVRSFDVVCADGSFRRVDHAREPALFDALRGGGGTSAVVTAVEFGLLPYSQVTVGSLRFEAEDVFAVLRGWRDWCSSAPNTVSSTFRILRPPLRPDAPEPLRAGHTASVDFVSLSARDAATLDAHLRYAARPVSGGFRAVASAERSRGPDARDRRLDHPRSPRSPR